MECPFCPPCLERKFRIADSNEHCLLLAALVPQPVLSDALVIVPRAHRATVLDLTREEWTATYDLLQRAVADTDRRAHPAGYTIGWDCGAGGGQQYEHIPLHLIPRHADQPLSGQGLRDWLNQPTNARPPSLTGPSRTHTWTEVDEVLALYLCKYGTDAIDSSIEAIADGRGISLAALRMRIRNFQSLFGRGSMRNYTRRSEAVYERYRQLAEKELRALAFPSGQF